MRNIVQVVHEERYNSGRYAFEVPIRVQLKPGDVVLVKTKAGDKIARCVTKNVMMSDDMIDMMMNGKKVTGQVLGKFEYQDFSVEKIEKKADSKASGIPEEELAEIKVIFGSLSDFFKKVCEAELDGGEK